jgi:hypothetical protein
MPRPDRPERPERPDRLRWRRCVVLACITMDAAIITASATWHLGSLALRLALVVSLAGCGWLAARWGWR